MINIKNSYGKLRELILGDIDYTVLDSVDQEHRTKLTYIFDQTAQDLDDAETYFRQLGIKVRRPKLLDSNKPIQTPYYETLGHKIPLTPRDHHLILGDTIVECSSWFRESVFSGFYYRDIFEEHFRDGAKWISMPIPTHNPQNIDPLDDGIPNREPMADAANFVLHNDVIFASTAESNNQLGIDWIVRHFEDKYKFIFLDSKKFKGHLDCHFKILEPGKIVTWHNPQDFPDYFTDWDFVQLDNSFDASISRRQKLLDGRIQDDDFMNTVLANNGISIDSETIILNETYKELPKIRELEKHVNIDFLKFNYSHFFNQGISCITLELNRDDE